MCFLHTTAIVINVENASKRYILSSQNCHDEKEMKRTCKSEDLCSSGVPGSGERSEHFNDFTDFVLANSSYLTVTIPWIARWNGHNFNKVRLYFNIQYLLCRAKSVERNKRISLFLLKGVYRVTILWSKTVLRYFTLEY